MEICRLTSEAIAGLLKARNVREPEPGPDGRRRAPRWPFPGTAELWIPDEDGIEYHSLATSLNLSMYGVGIRCDDELTPGLELSIALHEPEVSFHGQARVCHCAEMEDDYLVGLQFIFDKD